MNDIYFVFHGYGGENSLMPLVSFVKSKGHPVLVIYDQKFPYTRAELYGQLRDIKASYSVVFISSAHIWFDEYNYQNLYGYDPQMISSLELLEFLEPSVSAFYPHDMESFIHPIEAQWLNLFDFVFLPYEHNIFYRLKHICRRVEIVGWIKKTCETALHIDPENPVYTPAFFPSNIISFYSQLGAQGYADWFRRYIGPDIPIKMPAGDNGVYPLLTTEGFTFLDPSVSVYDAMNQYNLIIGSGHSSIIYEAALSGIPAIALLDGVFPDEVYMKSLAGVRGVYLLHPEELHDFLQKTNANHTLLDVGPNRLQPFAFDKVYGCLTDF